MKHKILIPLILLIAVAAFVYPRLYLLTSLKNAQPVEQNIDSTLNKLLHPTQVPEGKLASLKLPDGFNISYFAKDVPGARSLAIGGQGSIVYVGTREKSVYAVVDTDRDGMSEKIVKVASNLNTPNGVAIKGGDLYVAEVSRILRIKDIDNNYANNPSYEVVYDQLPKDTHHGWKYISFGPDGLLYIPIGAPCNSCVDQGKYARLITLNIDTKEVKTYATGIRNTVGFDWNPADNSLYFTDNGRDRMGDNIPRDELNHAPVSGLFFGFQFCHGNSTLDPQLSKPDFCDTHSKPAIELGPHVAALGMKFYRGNMFPSEYKNKVIIAEHGSWNRSTPIGYRLTTVDISDNKASNYQDFVTGWLEGDNAWGRPVDMVELPDGSLLISDDEAGAVYRLAYSQ